MASSIQQVVVDGLVLLKIMKHARSVPQEARGPLLGMVPKDGSHLEVSNCFPFAQDEGDDQITDEQFQVTMMRNLREVNVDHLQVGWYQASNLGSFLTEEFIATQVDYQMQTPEAVALIYDAIRTAQGTLCLKAYRLRDKFLAIWQEEDGDLTLDRLSKDNFAFEDILEELPLVLHTSHLSKALLEDLRSGLRQNESFDHLDLSTHVYLEKNVRLMMDCVDKLANETQKYQVYQRNLARQHQQRQQYLEKKKEENQVRQQQGLPPLPDEDLSALFKPLAPFSCLDTLLVASQISRYCKQVSQFTSQSFGRLYLAQALQAHEQ
eukprot:m.223704 g.223704  ORF g.223704 m.223704 type:complete len:322 (-) comp10964_c0_seq1:76-1041(-)